MEKITFYSYIPYLYVNLHKERGISVTFDKNGCYSTSNRIEIQLLREYIEKTASSYSVIEAGGELEQDALIQSHNKWEDNLIAEAESKKAEREQAEIKHKKDHGFYSMLRMTDTAYR